MAIVANLAIAGPLDQPFNSPNRYLAGAPNGVTTPQYGGELIEDTATGLLWKAQSITNTSWVQTISKNR